MFSYYFKFFGTGLIAASVITASLAIPAFTSGWALPIGVAYLA